MTDDRSLELAVGRVLRIGITTSSICLGTGLLLALLHQAAGVAHVMLQIGLIALLATPASRVVVSVIDYLLERDWLFVVLTLTVLGELLGSVVAAMYGRRG